MFRHTALAALAAAVANAASLITADAGYINFTTVTGYFLQDDPSTNATAFDYTAVNFGLINRTYPATDGITANLTQWQKFAIQVDALNAAAPLNTVYKVLFLGRHGQGYHNAAETFYGTPAWNCYWAELKGNSTTSWVDADLTAPGIAQAQLANAFWRHEIATQHIPFPQSYYTSPLTRCLKTANITFSGLELPEYYPFVPTVKELLREGISIHTCDHRGNKTYIQDLFPTYNIEEGFNEYDELWNGVTAESTSAQQKRSLTVLDDIFGNDDHTWISITSHSGEIGSILNVTGHRAFSLNTGAVIPVLIQAQFLPATRAPATTVLPFTTSTWCHNGPPITSNASLAQGCVCSATNGALSSLNTQAPFIPGQTAPINEFTTTTTVGVSASSAPSATIPTSTKGRPGFPFTWTPPATPTGWWA